MEFYKEIKRYERYSVTDEGRVWSSFSKKFLKPQSNGKGKGYLQVSLYNGKRFPKLFYVHRLVAKYFICNYDNLSEINHKDGNPSNNKVSNLEWVTKKQNIQHAVNNNLFPKKLSNQDVVNIRNSAKSGIKYIKIANLYKVNPATISKIINNKRRFHVS